MSTSRILTSTFRSVTRRATRAPTSRQSIVRSVARRGYASSHGGSAGAEKTSDLPWLAGAGGFTVVGLAWLLSGPSPKPSAQGSSSHATASESEPEPDPAAEDTSSDSDSSSSEPPTPPPSETSDSDSESSSSSSSSSSSPTPNSPPGQQVPPPSADNTDISTDPEGKKAAKEDYKGIIERKDTRAATSSSDVPSKKAGAEHPREDPQGGEGEGVQKGGPE
ncbi:hypothetical protein F4805DRAFT_461949 [Annulohypoxylon moriforme]|nr:hypothetical protein F4805DRAFT_461949 [Annulohypoxylon moriforme]